MIFSRLVVDVYLRPAKVGDGRLRYGKVWDGTSVPPVGAPVSIAGRDKTCHVRATVRNVLWYPDGGVTILLTPFFVDPAIEVERLVLRAGQVGVLWSTVEEEADLVELLEEQGFVSGSPEDAGCR